MVSRDDVILTTHFFNQNDCHLIDCSYIDLSAFIISLIRNLKVGCSADPCFEHCHHDSLHPAGGCIVLPFIISLIISIISSFYCNNIMPVVFVWPSMK